LIAGQEWRLIPAEPPQLVSTKAGHERNQQNQDCRGHKSDFEQSFHIGAPCYSSLLFPNFYYDTRWRSFLAECF
jgi:hypothetical protein